MCEVIGEEPQIDISKACRLCLVNDEGGEMTSIDVKNLESLGIPIYISKNHATRICKNCNAILEFIQKFRKMCENSNVYLLQYCLKDDQINDNKTTCLRPTSTEQLELNVEIENKPQELVIPEETICGEEEIQDNEVYQSIQADEIAIAKEVHVSSEEIERFCYEKDEENTDIEGENISEDEIDHVTENEFEPAPEYENIDEAADNANNEHNEAVDEMWIEETCEDDNVSDVTIYIDDVNINDEAIEKTYKIQTSGKRKFVSSPKDDKTTTTAASAVLHRIKKEKSSTNELHFCDICGNSFKRQGSLQSHRKRHFNQRPFECELCGEIFNFNFLLERHIRKHTGDRPFQCEICERRFVDRSTMSRHQKIHRNERAYKCEICEKTFTYYSVLKTHMMSHTGEKPFQCEICNKGFHRASDLKNHLETLQHRKDPRTEMLIQALRRR